MILSDLEIAERLEEYGMPQRFIDGAIKTIQRYRALPSARGRDEAVSLARTMFVKTGVERNITKAVEMLFDLLDIDFPSALTKVHKYSSVRKIPNGRRPKCPECNNPISLWQVNNSRKNQVGGNYKTQWICSDEINCGYQGDYSEMTIEEQTRWCLT